MYLSVYLFKNKSTGSHEVDFIIGNCIGGNNYKISCLERGGGGEVTREGRLLQNPTSIRVGY